MTWYEIFGFIFVLVFFGGSFTYCTIWEVRRIRETILREKSAREFYSEAGTYFARQNERGT